MQEIWQTAQLATIALKDLTNQLLVILAINA